MKRSGPLPEAVLLIAAARLERTNQRNLDLTGILCNR